MADDFSDATAWNKTRIEALSDGVFAIVLTLLVLEIKVPELPRQVAAPELWHALREPWFVFFSFVLTFLIAGAYWFLHHVSFHHIRTANGAVLGINLAFLMFVSLLPFSTAMLGSFTLHQPVSLGVYFGNVFAMGFTLNLLWRYS